MSLAFVRWRDQKVEYKWVSLVALENITVDQDKEKLIADQQRQIEKLKAERDAYLKSLYALLRKDIPPISEKELEEAMNSKLTLGEVLEEIERDLGISRA